MKKFTHLQSVIPKILIIEMRQRAKDVIDSIYDDYFSSKSFADFKSSHLAYNQSLVMQIATYRFASAEIITQLRELICNHIQALCGDNKLLIHPTCFLRFNFPNLHSSYQHRQALLCTEPHYDRTHIDGFNLYSLTFWVALDDIDEQSGGICLFDNREIDQYFASNNIVFSSYKEYLEMAQQIDPILSRGMIVPKLEAGDVLVFDSNLFHGATQPINRERLSFDFRLLPNSHLTTAPLFVRQCVEEINSAYDIFLANQLIHIGDFLGASRILRKIGKSTGNRDLLRVALAIGKKKPDGAVFK